MSRDPVAPSSRVMRVDPPAGPPFEGYPYLATRIGRSALRHLAVLPADWPPDRLVDLARRQARANRLDTCLIVGPADARYLAPDGTAVVESPVPTGLPVVERLRLAVELPPSAELEERRARLRAYAAAHRGTRYLVGDGLEGGRPASPADVARLRVPDDGRSSGLDRCPTCAELAGEFLAVRGEGNGDPRPRVLAVACRCANDNRCARCGAPLAARRLSSYSFDETIAGVRYTAAYAAFSHVCPDDPGMARSGPAIGGGTGSSEASAAGRPQAGQGRAGAQ